VDQRRHAPYRTRPPSRLCTHALTRRQPAAEDSPNTRTNTAGSSCTPLIYFDSDVSLDAANAVLLTLPKVAGAPFEWTEYCVPAAPELCSDAGAQMFGFDGASRSAQGTEDLRALGQRRELGHDGDAVAAAASERYGVEGARAPRFEDDGAHAPPQ
jgi:hypothetical protein